MGTVGRRISLSKRTFCCFQLLICVCASLISLMEASAQFVRPISVPGRIEAEDYDTNGPGISYFDDTPGNSGGVYRADDVDIEVTQDTAGGYDVGWISS